MVLKQAGIEVERGVLEQGLDMVAFSKVRLSP